jgi:hypothetical protein
MARPGNPLRLIAMTAGLAAGLAACEPGDDAGGSVKAPFGRFTDTTVSSYTTRMPYSSGDRFFAGVVGEVEVGGRQVKRYKIGYEIDSPAQLGEPDTQGAEFWINRSGDTLTVGGFQEAKILTATIEPPVTVDLAPPVGEPRQVVLSGTVVHVDDPTPKAAQMVVDAVMASGDASVQTDMGVVHGCRHYTGTIALSGEGVPEFLHGVPFAAEVWYHPDLGVVAGSLPELGLSTGLNGEADYGSATSGVNAIRRVATLSPANPSFELSTYDRAGELDADKNTHAKMLLELRWASDEDARTRDTPDFNQVRVAFTTLWGYFPHQFVESPVSFFHPEENGRGYRYWYAYVDEAAKNEFGSNGIVYKVRVDADPGVPPLRATARIRYRLFNE